MFNNSINVHSFGPKSLSHIPDALMSNKKGPARRIIITISNSCRAQALEILRKISDLEITTVVSSIDAAILFRFQAEGIILATDGESALSVKENLNKLGLKAGNMSMWAT